MQEIKIPEGRKVSIDFEKRVVVIESEKPKFKMGDIVIGDYFILPYMGISERQAVLFNCYFDKPNHISKVNSEIGVGCGYITDYRIATPSETQLLFDALAKEGKKWNAETLQIEDIEKDILVPESIGIYYQNSWNVGDNLLIAFNDNQQLLGFNTDTGQWFVKTYSSDTRRIQCKLTPCNREDLKAGDTALCISDDGESNIRNINDYCKIISKENIVFVSNNRNISVSCWNAEELIWYKIEPINN